MQKISNHQILAQAESLPKCREAILRFFEKTTLVRYDHIELLDEDTSGAAETDFFVTLDRAISKNHQMVKKLVKDLAETNITTISDLKTIQQGYPSKALHILAHFLDGFIGIDSSFYNLIEDSHWVSEELKNAMHQHPDHYFLFTLEGYSYTPEEAALLHM